MLPEAFDFSKRRKDSHGILALIPQLKASQLIGRIVVHSDGANTPNIPCLHIGVEEAWETSSPEKRHRIMEIFGITPTDLEILQGRDSILLMQRFTPDNFFAPNEEDKELDLYRRAVADAGKAQILLKRHPRDTRDYLSEKIGAPIYETAAPMELLSLLGLKLKRIYAISSTAALNMPEEVEICLIDQGAHDLKQELLIQELERVGRAYRMI